MSEPRTDTSGRNGGEPKGRLALGWLAAMFLAALGLRGLAITQYEAQHPLAQRPVIDEASYESWALEISGGDWLGDEIFFQEPLYPYWLASVYSVAGEDLAAKRSLARWCHAALGALTAVLVALLAARLFGRVAGLVAGFAFALYRPGFWMPLLLLKPNLFLPILALLALLLLRTRSADAGESRVRALALWGCVGLTAGLGALLRGNMLILLPFFVAWPVLRALAERRGLSSALPSAAAVVIGVTAALLPVALRNQVVGGELVLSTSGAGTNFYGGNNLDNPYGVATEFDWVRGIPEHEADDWRHEAERRLGRELEPTEVSSYWLGQALDSMRSDPLAHARILLDKLRLTLGTYEVPDNHFLAWDARYVPMLAPDFPGFWLWGWLGLAGLMLFVFRAFRGELDERARGPGLELAALWLLYLGTIVMTVTSARVRLALVPLMLVFAGYLVVSFRRGREWSLPALVASALAFLLVSLPVFGEEQREKDLHERDFNLLVGWLEDPATLDEAEGLARELLATYPNSVRVQIAMADVEYRRARRILDSAGPTDEAERLVQSSLGRLEACARRGKPRERFQAGLLAGAILQFRGQWDAAVDAYRSARAFDPGDADVLRRLAVVLAESGMARPQGPDRAARLREAESILVEELDAEQDPELQSLLAGIREQL